MLQCHHAGRSYREPIARKYTACLDLGANLGVSPNSVGMAPFAPFLETLLGAMYPNFSLGPRESAQTAFRHRFSRFCTVHRVPIAQTDTRRSSPYLARLAVLAMRSIIRSRPDCHFPRVRHFGVRNVTPTGLRRLYACPLGHVVHLGRFRRRKRYVENTS